MSPDFSRASNGRLISGESSYKKHVMACRGWWVGVAIATLAGVNLSGWSSAKEEPAAAAKPAAVANPAAEAKPSVAANDDQVPKELVSGEVRLLTDVLQKRGIKFYDEMRGQVVLETAEGEVFPIVSDWRGRAFYQDERLRNRKVDLVVRRHKGLPHLQVLMVFAFDERGEREYMDYWCDICSIPMYEIKDCECCQGPIRLRFQPQDLPVYVQPGAKK